MRRIQVHVPDLVIALPDHQHFFGRLNEIDRLLRIEQESRRAVWPAACLAGESRFPGIDVAVPFADLLFGPWLQDGCVRIAHFEDGLRAARDEGCVARAPSVDRWHRTGSRGWWPERSRRGDPSDSRIGRKIRRRVGARGAYGPAGQSQDGDTGRDDGRVPGPEAGGSRFEPRPRIGR